MSDRYKHIEPIRLSTVTDKTKSNLSQVIINKGYENIVIEAFTKGEMHII